MWVKNKEIKENIIEYRGEDDFVLNIYYPAGSDNLIYQTRNPEKKIQEALSFFDVSRDGFEELVESILFNNERVPESAKKSFSRKLLMDNLPKELFDKIFPKENTFVLTFEVHITSRGETVEEAIENALNGGYCLTEDDITSTREVEPENEGE